MNIYVIEQFDMFDALVLASKFKLMYVLFFNKVARERLNQVISVAGEQDLSELSSKSPPINNLHAGMYI